MATQEIVKILKVQTEGSERTVKGLKDEISALKDALLNVEQGTEQYDDIVKQLRQDQEDLQRVMNAGKKDLDALEGSYNYLVKTMSELKKEWRATTDEVKRNELGQQIDNINNQLKEMDASIGNFQRNVGNYADGFSEAMKRQQEATELTRTKLESISKVASGLASGYAGLQGAMALMGVENKKLQETFVKLQAAIALAQGVGGIKDLVEGLGMAKVAFKGAMLGVKSFITSLKGVKLAIAGTGIGLLVVAVGTLAEALISMSDDTDNATDSLKDFNDELDKTTNYFARIAISEYNFALKQYLKEIEKAGGDVNKLAEAEKNLNKVLGEQELERLQKEFKILDKQVKDVEHKLWHYITWTKGTLGKENEEYEKELQKTLEDTIQKRASAEQKILDIKVNAQKEATSKIIELAEKQADKQKKLLEERNNIINKIAEGYRTAEEQELYELEQIYNKEKELIKDNYDDSLMLLEQYEYNKFRIKIKYANEALTKKDNKNKEVLDTEQTFEEQEVEVKFNAKESKTEVEAINIEIEKLTELEELRIKYHNLRLEQIQEILDNENISSENKKALEKEKAELIQKNAIAEKNYINEVSKLNKNKIKEEKKLKNLQISSSIDATRNLLDATSKLFKENSKEQKGIATAVATIDALKSANAAYYAMAGIPVVGPALGVAAAASALISGYANVKAIWATDESGANAESLLNSTPETSSVGVTPTFNAESALPVEYTRNILTNSETDTLNNSMKVYVLESDITETQNKVTIAEDNATF